MDNMDHLPTLDSRRPRTSCVSTLDSFVDQHLETIPDRDKMDLQPTTRDRPDSLSQVFPPGAKTTWITYQP